MTSPRAAAAPWKGTPFSATDSKLQATGVRRCGASSTTNSGWADEYRPSAVRSPSERTQPRIGGAVSDISRSTPAAGQQGQFTPFPVAIHVPEANLAQPSQLDLQIQQFVRRVFSVQCAPDAAQEFLVKLWRHGRYMLEIAKYATGGEACINLSVKGALAFVDEMMNSEARNHDVKTAQVGKRVFKIVGQNRNRAIVGKTPACRIQHGGREIHGDGNGVRTLDFDQGEKPPVSGAKIENPLCGWRNKFEKRRLAFDPVRDRDRRGPDSRVRVQLRPID